MKIILSVLLMCSAVIAGPDRTRSVVAIRVRGQGSCVIDQYGKKTCRPGPLQGTGSGCVIDYAEIKRETGTVNGCMVLTAAHVVRGGASFEVKLAGKWRTAWIRGDVPPAGDVDLALMLVDCDFETENVNAIAVADADPPGPEPIESLGFDEGIGDVVRPDAGVIDGGIFDVDSDDGTGQIIKIRHLRKIKTRYSSTTGRSGCPIIDCESRIVGVLSCRDNRDTREANCVPVSKIREFLKVRWRIPPSFDVEPIVAPEPPPAPSPAPAEPQPTPADSQSSVNRHSVPYVRAQGPSVILPLPYVDCPNGTCPPPPMIRGPAQCACMREIAALKERLASVERMKSTPGPQGPPGPAGLPGERGEVAEVPQSAVNAAVSNYLKSNPSSVTVVIEDNGKQVYSKSGVPAGSVIRVPIQRVEKTNAR